VIAILITITVLELRTPHGTVAPLREDMPVLLAYMLTFVNIGIYWNNHHNPLAAVSRVSGMALWANQAPAVLAVAYPRPPRPGFARTTFRLSR
jgi:uncharacterized membrane protein